MILFFNKKRFNKGENMLPEERRTKILELLEKERGVKVSDLVKIFNVTGATIRRDLETLEKEGLLKRTHGGAVLPHSFSFEPLYITKKRQNLKEKQAIGKVAAELINDGESVFIETGSTTLQIAKNIKHKHDVTVITNSIEVARELLSARGVEVILTGGLLRKETVALIGPLAERVLKEFRVDKVFLGISGIIPSKGMYTASIAEAQIKKLIIEMGREIIGVSDHSKFGKECFAFVAPTKAMNKIIVDEKVPTHYIDELKNQGVEVIIAPVED
ncbi:MAG: DeoR/GlpR family DNA-binding transcription regulator [Dictyoglomus thermophilum]|nr:DeoR/GlpR family DNA-binding transcription regulator [Dictyoglomus thermophilum]